MDAETEDPEGEVEYPTNVDYDTIEMIKAMINAKMPDYFTKEFLDESYILLDHQNEDTNNTCKYSPHDLEDEIF